MRWYDLGGEDSIVNYLRNGTITVGDTPTNGIDLNCWRAQIGLVQQDPFLFDDTIYKNVEYGLVGTQFENASDEVRQALVEQACKDAYADEFIRHLPEVSISLNEVNPHLPMLGLRHIGRTSWTSAKWWSTTETRNRQSRCP